MVDGYIRKIRKKKKKELINLSYTKVIVNFFNQTAKGLN